MFHRMLEAAGPPDDGLKEQASSRLLAVQDQQARGPS